MRNIIYATIITLTIIFVGVVIALISPFLLGGIVIGLILGGIIGAGVAVNLNPDRLSEILGRVNINSISSRQAFAILGLKTSASFQETYQVYREKLAALDIQEGLTELEISELDYAKERLTQAYKHLIEIRLWHKPAEQMAHKEEQEKAMRQQMLEMEMQMKEAQAKALEQPSIEERQQALQQQRIAQQELLAKLAKDRENADKIAGVKAN